MPALVRHGVDKPHIALCPDGRDHVVGDAAFFPRLIDILRLRLSRHGSGILAHAAPRLFAQGGRGGNGFGNGKPVIEITPALGEHENMLMAAGAAVFGTLRHGVSLCPDHVIAQIPAVGAERKGQHPRNTDHVLLLAAPHRLAERNVLPVAPLRIFGVAGIAFAACAAIAVRDIYPQSSIRAQHPAHLAEYRCQPRNVFLRRSFPPDLCVHAVIPQPVVGRRGHAAMDAALRQGFQHIQTVAAENGIKLHHHTPFTSLGLVDIMR